MAGTTGTKSRALKETHVTLGDGYRMPVVGLGTANMVEAEVLSGLRAGARHLDCARMYGNEAAVGRALKASGVKREDLFVTSKIFNDEHAPDRVERAVEASLQALGLEYLDLVLIHWPVSWRPGTPFVPDPTVSIPRDTWPALAALVERGKIRSLGCSNFDASQLEPLLSKSPKPVVNQIEAHPLFQNAQLVDFCSTHGIRCVAWGPLAKGRSQLSQDPRLFAVSRMRFKSEFEIALRWNLDRGVCVVPKSTNPLNVKRNLAVVSLPTLSDHDHRLLALSDTGSRRFPDLVAVWPSTCHPLAHVLKAILALSVRLYVRLFGPIDVVAIAQRKALRREAHHAASSASAASSSSSSCSSGASGPATTML